MTEGTITRAPTPYHPHLIHCPGCGRVDYRDHYHALHFVQNRWLVTEWHYACRPDACETADRNEGIV